MQKFFIFFFGLMTLTAALPALAQTTSIKPSIYALSPASGPTTTNVTIQGSNFSLDAVNNISIDGGGGSYGVAAAVVRFNCPMIPVNATSTSCGKYTDILKFTVPTAVGPYCPPAASMLCAQYMRTIMPGVHTIAVITSSGKSNSVNFTVTNSSLSNTTTTIAPLSCKITRTLSFGSTGKDVFCLQKFLTRDTLIYPKGLVTGYFGSLTRQAVIRFQAAHKIAKVGIVGPLTRFTLSTLQSGK
jgi:hypothetical protein